MWISLPSSRSFVATAVLLFLPRHPLPVLTFTVVPATHIRTHCRSQANLIKQLSKLVKVRYVEDITSTNRIGEGRRGHRAGAEGPRKRRTRKGKAGRLRSRWGPPATGAVDGRRNSASELLCSPRRTDAAGATARRGRNLQILRHRCTVATAAFHVLP